MSLNPYIRNQYHQLLDYEENLYVLKDRLSTKKTLGRLLWLYFPDFIFNYFWIGFLSFISPIYSKKKAAKYIRNFFYDFFRIKGFTIYETTNVIPKQVHKPTLYFGIRYNHLSSLFAYQAFEHPIIIPMSYSTRHMKLYRYLPFNPLTKMFECISYSDAPLTQNIKNIETLLNAGYPVYVHINHGMVDFASQENLLLHKGFSELLKMDVPKCYINFLGLENYPYINLKTPGLVGIDFKEDHQLYDLFAAETENEKLTAISQFFGFNSHVWV